MLFSLRNLKLFCYFTCLFIKSKLNTTATDTTEMTTEMTKLNPTYRSSVNSQIGKKNDILDAQFSSLSESKQSVSEKRPAQISSKFHHVFSLANNSATPRTFNLEKMLSKLGSVKKPTVDGPKETGGELPGFKRNASISGLKNNGSYIIFGADSANLFGKPVMEPATIKKIPTLKKRHRKPTPTFLRRRLLSINDIDDSTG